MARSLLRSICKICPKPSLSSSLQSSRLILRQELAITPFRAVIGFNSSNPCWNFRNYSYGTINLVTTDGNPKFEINEIDPPKKHKFQTKKRLKMKRKKEKQKRRSANKRDPRHIGVKGGKKKKQKFDTAELRIKNKIEKAKIKENLLIERLKRYEVDKVQGPVMEKIELSGEERFYMKKMAQKGSNYVPVGRRGVFGGVILNMHMHWKKHETVKVICKPCKPGQVHEYAEDIARLSGGIPIHILGDDTIVFYRGKDYEQPQIMSPIDTLSKKRALEKSKYQQSLESVRRFIAIAEKELELYYRHIALYGNPANRDPNENIEVPIRHTKEHKKFDELKNKTLCSSVNGTFQDFSVSDVYSAAEEVSEDQDEDESEESDMSDNEFDSCDDITEKSSSRQELSCGQSEVDFECREFVSKSHNLG